ncbi:MAG: hypothetical protein SNI70_10660, partial [Rikenellaceae bacterium]
VQNALKFLRVEGCLWDLNSLSWHKAKNIYYFSPLEFQIDPLNILILWVFGRFCFRTWRRERLT